VEKKANYVGTLAAAYAESGDFDAAVTWQTKALEFVAPVWRKELESRIELYRAKKPFRVAPPNKPSAQ
jgi:hypothetical protein